MRQLIKSSSGAAAAEMALVAPLLIGLMFGSMELGFYFYSEHVVVKAVRDGARFAARNGFDKFDCSNSASGDIDSSVKTEVQRVTRTSSIDGSGDSRIRGWTDDTSVQVDVSCDASGGYGSFYQGVTDSAGQAVVPIVTVTATVAYPSLFQRLGFNATNIDLTAASEAPVMGI